MSVLSQFFGGGGGGSSVPAAQGGEVADGITVAEVLLVGGGGNGETGYGGPGPARGYGGQGGAVLASTAIFFTQGTSYTITIGGAASNSSIVGGTINLVADGGKSASSPTLPSLYRDRSKTRIDEYTTLYAEDSVPWLTSNVFGVGHNSGGGGAISRGGKSIIPASPATWYPGGDGGDGFASNISAAAMAYGAGGGGGGRGQQDNGYQVFVPLTPGGLGGSGGSGAPASGGGNGGPGSGNVGTNGVANTGGGGGGGGGAKISPAPIAAGAGGSGGSGVCIIRWPTAYPDAPAVSGNTPTPAQPGYRVYRWNSGPGSITF